MDKRELGYKLGLDVVRGRDTSSLMFVLEAQSENSRLDDVTVLEHSDAFPVWDRNWTGKVGRIVRDPDDGQLYRKVNADFNTAYPQSQPSVDKSQWKLIGDPGEEWPEWSPPIGAHDTYMKGDKVTFKGKRYESAVDYNAYSPEEYPPNWKEAV